MTNQLEAAVLVAVLFGTGLYLCFSRRMLRMLFGFLMISNAANLVLIAISGVWTKAADRQLGEALGFDHYVLKPCDPRELLPLLKPLRQGAKENGEGAC